MEREGGGMTTDELIHLLRDKANLFGVIRDSSNRDLLDAAADRLEEQDKIIKQYQKADCFLAAHGWEWEEGGCWYDD